MTLAYMTNGDSSGKVYVVDANSTKILTPTSGITVGDSPYGVAFTPDGSQAVVTNWHHDETGSVGTISFINTISGTVVATRSPGGKPNGVAIAQSGDNIYAYIPVQDSYSPSGTDFLAIYDMADYSEVTTINLPSGAMPFGVAATPNNNYVYVAESYVNGSGPGKVSVFQTSDNTFVTRFAVADYGYTSYGIGITPTGSPPRCFVTLVQASESDGKVAYFAADGSSHVPSYVDVGVYPTGVATDGDMVYVATMNDHRVYYFSATSPPSSASYVSTGAGTYPCGVALAPDSSKLYVSAGGADKTMVYATGSPPSLITSILSSGGGSFGMFIQQNPKANTPFVGGASAEWFGC